MVHWLRGDHGVIIPQLWRSEKVTAFWDNVLHWRHIKSMKSKVWGMNITVLILLSPKPMYVERIFSPHIVAVCCPAKMPIIFFVSIFHVSECLLCKWIFRTWRKGKGMWKIKYEFCVIIMVWKEWDANKGRNIKLSFSNLSLLFPKRYKARGNFKHKNLIVLNVKYYLEGKWSLLAGRQGVECSLKMLSVKCP